MRVTPEEIHIQDSDYFEELFSRSNRYEKWEATAGRFGASTMTFTTANSDLHALRRAPLNPMFSKRSIAKFEPVIHEKVALLCDGILKAKKNGDFIGLSDGFNAFGGDVIMEYCFGFCYDHLKSPEFKENFHLAFVAVGASGHLAVQWPMLYPVRHPFSTHRWMEGCVM